LCVFRPVRAVTLNGGAQMPAWFDLRPLGQKTDEDGIRNAAVDVQELIKTEVSKVDLILTKEIQICGREVVVILLLLGANM